MTAPRIHIADRPPAPSGRARGRCGIWSFHLTRDAAATTCLRCKALARPIDVGNVGAIPLETG